LIAPRADWILPPWARRALLVLHVTASVGWLGSVVAFLALAVAGISSADEQFAGSMYIAMEVVTRLVILPLCFASLLTGFVQSLGTSWGLIRHYWIIAKLVLTVVSTIILLIHVQPIRDVAGIALHRAWELDAAQGIRVQLLVDAAAATVVLLIATALSVFKPEGITPFGWRMRQLRVRSDPAAD
jgi:hypothetical protein